MRGGIFLFTFQNYSFTYAGAEHPALHDINLHIRPGEWVWLCGASGSGKTTLLQGLHPETQPAGKSLGSLLWEGREFHRTDRTERILRVVYFHAPEGDLPVFSTVRETLSAVMENLGWSQQRIHMRLAEVCRYFSLDDILDAAPEELSGGQQQLVNLAGMLMTDPDCLIVDEPLAQLDPILRDQWLRFLQKLQEEKNLTVILSGHEPELLRYCHRVVLLEKGAVAFQGARDDTAAYLYNHPRYRALVPDIPALALRLDPGCKPLPHTVQQGRRLLDMPMDVQHPPQQALSDAVVLQAKQVVFAFDETMPLLRHASLELHAGERFYLFGGNGSGKSTFLRLLAGHAKPLEGRILRHGDEKVRQKKPRPLPYLSQYPRAYFKEATVKGVAQRVSQTLSGTDTSRAEALYEAFHLSPLANRHPFDLSAGERQRLGLFIILAQPGYIYLLDEPTGGLDAEAVQAFQALLRSPLMADRTVLMCGHDMAFAAAAANRAAILFDGFISEPLPVLTFLAQNAFYTTDLHRLFVARMPDVVVSTQIEPRRL